MLNVSEATLYWYRASFKTWSKYSAGDPKTWVMGMRAAGISPRSVNTHICALNAYWKWAGEPIHLKYLKEEQKILATLSESQIHQLLHFKQGKGFNTVRAHLAALTILDTGLRASELLGLTKEDIDLDNLAFKVKGKGGKHRLVPFSIELRKRLYLHSMKASKRGDSEPALYLFGTKHNTQVTIRNLERDLKVLGQKAGITGVRFSPHTLRHTFAVSWLKRGGDIYSLSRILGHSNIQTTTIYLRSLGIADLQKSHARVSILSQK